MNRRALRAGAVLAVALMGAASSVPAADVSETEVWGEVVDGVQMRLALATVGPPALPGELPALAVQIRNQGSTAVAVRPEAIQFAKIEIDGVWYEQPIIMLSPGTPVVIPPDSQSGIGPIQRIASQLHERDSRPVRQLELRPGSHRIRIANAPELSVSELRQRIERNAPALANRITGKDLPSLVSNRIAIDVPAATSPSQAMDYQLKGWNLQVSLDPEKTSFVQGEPIYVFFTVHNNSAEDLAVIVGGDDWNELLRPEKFKVQVTRGNGSTIPVRELPSGMPMSGNRWIGPQKIPARGSYRFSLLVANWAELKEPGEYAITASRTLDLQKYSQSDMSWMEDPSSVEHLEVKASGTITLAPFDHAALGAVIDARGRTMLQETRGLPAYMASEAAAHALALIDDDRVVPYFRRTVLESTDSSMLSIAIRALGRFNSDTALDTLVQVTRSPKDSTRHSAAVSLSKSPHPGATDELLKLRSDPYRGVRITVLQTLATMQTAESLQMIREMTNDGDESLRVEALRYLRLRTEGMKP